MRTVRHDRPEHPAARAAGRVVTARAALPTVRAVRTADGPAAPAGLVARWARRKLGRLGHERRVLSVADELFDLLAGRLGLAECDRRLLRLAALTHDVGRSLSEKDHPRQGAALIARTHALKVSPACRRRLAYLTRYHRGAVPPAGREEYLRPSDPRPALRATLALLRAADALDSRHLPHPRVSLSMVGGRLHVRCVVAGHLAESRRVFGRRKKFRLLELLLGRAVVVSVVAER